MIYWFAQAETREQQDRDRQQKRAAEAAVAKRASRKGGGGGSYPGGDKVSATSHQKMRNSVFVL